MNGTKTDEPRTTGHAAVVLVWIDAREAVVVRWVDGEGAVEHVESDVPPNIRSTGQVRHAPGVRHGGGAGASSAEQHREEHLARFVAGIAERLPADADLVILGPGTIRDQLERRLRDADRGRPRPRSITSEAATRHTDRQLVARLRTIVGETPPRRHVGEAGTLAT